MEHLIEYAVNTIRERYYEPLSLDELAQSVMVSKFHFLRTFRRVTGVTPGRFLSAVRLHEAKRLLLTTPLNVSNISVQVGYSSTGSFTRRFTESVGCSPTQYRQLRRGHGWPVDADWTTERATNGANTSTVSGTVVVPDPDVSAVYLGVFESPILERCPAVRAVITEPGPFQLTGVPEGTWFIHAVSHGTYPDDVPCSSRQDLLVGTVGPIDIGRDTVLHQDLALRPLCWSHPPVLLALPDLLRAPVAAA